MTTSCRKCEEIGERADRAIEKLHREVADLKAQRDAALAKYDALRHDVEEAMGVAAAEATGCEEVVGARGTRTEGRGIAYRDMVKCLAALLAEEVEPK